MQYTLLELTKGLDVTIQGDPNCQIYGVCPIQQSQAGHITFLTNSHYRKFLVGTNASAVIATAEDAVDCPVTVVISRHPHYAYAKIAAHFEKKVRQAAGIHASVVMGSDCVIDKTASIAAGCVLGNHVRVGRDVVIGSGTMIGDEAEIGDESLLDARVTIYDRVQIGQRAQIKSGTVIGGDGFGYANYQGAWHRVPQMGTVVIGDDVSIGANTTIDRGAVDNTVIGNGVKLDNLIQVGHNVRIGDDTIIAGCTAIAGTTDIGKNCMIGGASCFAGHLSVCDNVIVTGMTAVTKSITEPGMYSSGIVGAVPNLEFRKNNARFYRLESLMQRMKQLESDIKVLTERRDS